MHCVRKISNDLFWVGSEDKRINLFENIFPIEKGMAYNSYLLMDEKIALIDTVDQAVGNQFIENIEFLLKDKAVDYLVISHMEPDHASIIQELTVKYPNMKIIGNIHTEKMLKQFFTFDVDEKIQVVQEYEKLNTGKHTLRFIFAPMVHWPEVMVTYDENSKTLFSADAFGSFGALNGNLYNTDIDIEKDFIDEARRYYANIVGKYGIQVQSLLSKISSIEIQKICPLHGQIWVDNLEYIIDKYDKWSKYEPEEEAVVIIYASIYGHTENVAGVLANYLAENGIKNIKMYDVSKTDTSVLVAESFRCSNIAIASVTYNMGIFPMMQEYLADITRLNLQNRTVSIIGNATWAPGAVIKQIKDKLQEMKNMKILGENLSIKSSMKEEDRIALQQIGDEIVKSLKETTK